MAEGTARWMERDRIAVLCWPQPRADILWAALPAPWRITLQLSSKYLESRIQPIFSGSLVLILWVKNAWILCNLIRSFSVQVSVQKGKTTNLFSSPLFVVVWNEIRDPVSEIRNTRSGIRDSKSGIRDRGTGMEKIWTWDKKNPGSVTLHTIIPTDHHGLRTYKLTAYKQGNTDRRLWQ